MAQRAEEILLKHPESPPQLGCTEHHTGGFVVMTGNATKFLSIPQILDAIERAEFASSVSWPADRLYALWQQAKPSDTPDPEWFDPEDEEEIDLGVCTAVPKN